MKALKRASVGGYVQADVTGMGEWLVGRITTFNDTSITFQPADGSELVKVARAEVYKATKEEFDDAYVENVTQQAQTQEEDIVVPEILAEEAEAQPKGTKNGLLSMGAVSKYVVGVTGNGRKSKHNGDAIATLFEGKTLDEVFEIAAEQTGSTVADLSSRWSHLNHGMQRMNVGNFVRRHLKKQAGV